MDFKEMYGLASSICKEQHIEQHTYIGEVAVVLVTKSGKVYTGKSIKMTCSLGVCAEVTAVSNMILEDEFEIKKMVAVYEGGNIITPCGKCREFLYQLNHNNLECEIMISDNKIVKLKDLLPCIWSEMK
jgi:cytidine deaminase